MDNLSLKDPVLISNLMLFPIISIGLSPQKKPRDFSFKTLEEGLRELRVNINEAGNGHSSVRVSNNYADSNAFIIDGEGISGGKQNRISASSLVISPQRTKKIPVFCSEHGRWAGSNTFDSSNSIAYPSIRRLYTSGSSQHYSTRDSQSSVWSEISKTMNSLKVSSPTQSMQEIYAKKEDELQRFKEYEPQKNQVGFMAATHRKILCIDIFYNHVLFGKFRVKLLISYALDALKDARSTKGSYSVKNCEKFYSSLSRARFVKEDKKTSENHYITDSAIGKVLFYRGQPIHASFFPKV